MRHNLWVARPARKGWEAGVGVHVRVGGPGGGRSGNYVLRNNNMPFLCTNPGHPACAFTCRPRGPIDSRGLPPNYIEGGPVQWACYVYNIEPPYPLHTPYYCPLNRSLWGMCPTGRTVPVHSHGGLARRVNRWERPYYSIIEVPKILYVTWCSGRRCRIIETGGN